MRRIYILGETTYDIVFKNNKPIDAKVGGSQLNTAVSLGRLKLPVSFISQIGNDIVGDICASFIKENSISDSLVIKNAGASRVALAFLDENNDANYNFYKAENTSRFSFPEINENDIILFGSSLAIRKDIRDELFDFLTKAKEKNAIIIYDPNFRKSNVLNHEERLKLVKQNIQLASIVKGSDEDFTNIFGINDAENVWKEISKMNVAAMFYTSGKNGVKVQWGNESITLDVPKIKPVSTIGAGDNFNAGLIFSMIKKEITKNELNKLSDKDWSEIASISIQFAQQVCLSYDNYVSYEFARSMK